MKNIVINNQEVQVSPNKNLKTKLEVQIAELQSQEGQITKQLKSWEAKLKKANNLAHCLETAEKFADKLLTEAIESEKTKEQPDIWWLEHLLKNKVEFALKFEAGTEAFAKLILGPVERQVQSFQNKLENIQNQLHHQERKFARLQARRQGKVLLDCEYRKSLGCLGAYQCDNCQVNYSVASESNQLENVSY